jgi:hypothetical protein
VFRLRKLSIGWQKDEFMLIEKEREAAQLDPIETTPAASTNGAKA